MFSFEYGQCTQILPLALAISPPEMQQVNEDILFAESTLSEEELGRLRALEVQQNAPQEHTNFQALQQGSAQWHAARAPRITASDVPSAIAVDDAWSTPEDLVQTKVNGGSQISAAMQHGITSEPLAADAYKAMLTARLPAGSSVSIEETGFWVHARMPHIGASPDRRVRIAVDGVEQPLRHVQIKCPHSKPLESFKPLPDAIAVQVIVELAVLHSHQPSAAGEMDVFVWKADQVPVLHTISWSDVRQRWYTRILPKVNAFYFRLLEPQLRRKGQQHSTLLGKDVAAQDGQPTKGSAEATPVRLNLHSELRVEAAARMAATAAAEAHLRASTVSVLSPIQLLSPAFKVGKRVQQVKTARIGTIVSVCGDQAVITWDDAASCAAEHNPPGKATRQRPTALANLNIIPVDLTSRRYAVLSGSHVGESVVVISGRHAGKLGTCGTQTGQNYRIRLQGTTQDVSISATQLRRKITQEQGVGALTLAKTKPSIIIPRSTFVDWLVSYCKEHKVEVVLLKPSSRAELEKNLTCPSGENEQLNDVGKGKRVSFSALYGCHRGLASKASSQLASEKPVASSKVGCPWQMRLTCFCSTPDEVTIDFPVSHQNHTPGSAEDNALLKPSAATLKAGKAMLEMGLKPAQIMLLMDNAADVEVLHSGGSLLASYSLTRSRLRQADLDRLRKQLTRETLIDVSDVKAVEALAVGLKEQGVLLHYQPQVVKDGKEVQHLIIIICSAFQRQMLHRFGARLAFMDATGGTNKYGYMLTCILCVDDFMNGVPGAFMISSSETAETLALFVRKVEDAINADVAEQQSTGQSAEGPATQSTWPPLAPPAAPCPTSRSVLPPSAGPSSSGPAIHSALPQLEPAAAASPACRSGLPVEDSSPFSRTGAAEQHASCEQYLVSVRRNLFSAPTTNVMLEPSCAAPSAVAERVHGAQQFKFASFMIDKSTAEICALGTTLQRMWHLCLFHVLQDWERFLKSSEAGVKDKADRIAILHALKRLSAMRDKDQFAAANEDFKREYAQLKRVVDHYSKSWESDAEHWAQWGRKDIWDLMCNTNNFLERFFGLFKHSFCCGQRSARLAQLMQTLVSKVIPHYIRDRLKKEAGLLSSRYTGIRAKHAHNVHFLVAGGLIRVTDATLGLAEVASQKQLDKTYTVCVSDHSCECSAFGEQSGVVCKHLEAASSLCPFTLNMRAAAARHMLKCNSLRPLKSSQHGHMFEISAMAAEGVRFVCNLDSNFCSCADWAANGRLCCHLMAAAAHSSSQQHRAARVLQEHESDTDAEPIIVRRCFPENANSSNASSAQMVSKRMEAELEVLRRYETATAVQSKKVLTEQHKAALGLCRNINALVHTLDSAAMHRLLPLLQDAAAVVEESVPRMLPTLRTAQKCDSRMDSDRSHKPLFPSRKRPAATIATAADALERGRCVVQRKRSAARSIVAERIVKRASTHVRVGVSSDGAITKRVPSKFLDKKPPGRPHTAVRQLGSNIRGPKRMYAKRLKRGSNGAP